MRTMSLCRRFGPALILILLLAAGHRTSAFADDSPAFQMGNQQEYTDCMTLARRAPEDAYESALAWQGQGGGDAARHCAAVAMIGVGKYPEAAQALEKLGGDVSRTKPGLAAEIFGQAGQAWTMANDTKHAYAAQTTGLKLNPQNVDLLVDRAVSEAALNDYKAAADDLTKAQTLAPERADILAYRASAWRYLGDLKRARRDADTAINLDPKNTDALLERGIIRRLTNDPEGARKDWLQAALIGAGTPAGDAAQLNLEKLDLKP
jgi:tetratricopeptide (TPR) repeat protein